MQLSEISGDLYNASIYSKMNITFAILILLIQYVSTSVSRWKWKYYEYFLIYTKAEKALY